MVSIFQEDRRIPLCYGELGGEMFGCGGWGDEMVVGGGYNVGKW